MTTNQQIVGEPKTVLRSEIYVDEDENSRHDMKDIDTFAGLIKEQGLLSALTVTNGGSPDPKKPYRLRAGFRRFAALTILKVKEIPVVVVPDIKTGIKNLAENINREQLPSIDLAARLAQLEAGTVPGSEEKYTKKELAAQLGMSLSHVSNLIRADKNCTLEAKKVWRKHDVPTTTVFAWASLNEEEQLKAIDKWTRDQERIKARSAGKSEGEETKGKKGKKEEEEPKKKPMVKGKNASMIQAYKEVLEWQLETGALKGQVEKAEALRQLDTFRFLLGDLSRMPGISATDVKAYESYLKKMEAEEAKKAEEEGE